MARGLTGLAVAAVCLAGARLIALRSPSPIGTTVRAAVIQGSTHGPLLAKDVNTPLTQAEEQRALRTYESLTKQASASHPALVVWPESTLPGVPEQEPWIEATLSRVVRESGAWLLAGGAYVDSRGRTFNSAYLYSPTGNQTARYDKVQLVPFGEYVPGRSRIPFLSRYHVRAYDFMPGAVHTVLQAGTIGLGPMICFESIFPGISWLLADHGAQVLVIITNDAWFGRTAAAAQHRQIAVLRAVETGRWVLRGASTGISSIIAPDGRIVAEAGLYQPAVLVSDIQLVGSGPPRLRQGFGGQGWGPVFAWLMVGLSVGFLIAPLAAPRGRRPGRTAPRESRRERPGRATPR